jgi:uncharacterized protein (DUF362 family)
LKVANPRAIKKFKVAKLAVDSAIITVPSMKTLQHTSITMGLKNMFGMLTTRNKFSYHAYNMNKVIYDICKTLLPTLSVIDGFYGKSGGGPWSGDPVKMDTIIASIDPIAADAIGARCVGIEPETIDHVRWLHETGVGTMNDFEIVGNNISDVYQKWEI